MRSYLPYFLSSIPAIIGLLIYKWRAGIDRQAAIDRAVLAAEQSPMEILKSALANRDKEISDARVQLYSFMNNHLSHDSAEREALGKVLSGINEGQHACVDALRELGQSFAGHREEEARRTGDLHKKLEAIHLDIAKGAP